MATFEFQARVKAERDEEFTEWGTVVAPTRSQAEEKIVARGLVPITVRQLTGLKALFRGLKADIK